MAAITEETYCLIELLNSSKKIVLAAKVREKIEGKGWVTPTNHALLSGGNPLCVVIDGVKQPITSVVAIGTLDQLRVVTSRTEKRVIKVPRRSFPPSKEGLTKKAASTKLLTTKKKEMSTKRKVLSDAKQSSERLADKAYKKFALDSSAASTADSEATNIPELPMNDSATTEVLQPDASPIPSTPATSVASPTHNSMVLSRSITMYNLHAASSNQPGCTKDIEFVPGSNVKQRPKIVASTPLSSRKRQPDKTELTPRSAKNVSLRSGVVEKLPSGKQRKSTVVGLTDVMVDELATGPSESYRRAIIAELMKIRTGIDALRRRSMTADEHKELLLSCLPAKANVASSQPTKQPEDVTATNTKHDELIPDEAGNLQLLPGFECGYNTCAPALLAKTMRRRANEVMRILWTDAQIVNLFVRCSNKAKRYPDVTDDDEERTMDDPTNLTSVVDARDWSKIINICRRMQAVNEIPILKDSDRVELNVRVWASEWLKNQRMRIKSAGSRQPSHANCKSSERSSTAGRSSR